HLMELSPEAATLALRAMRTVAESDGELAASEHDLIEAAAALLGAPIDPARLERLRPDELEGAALPTRDAERVVQAAILTALMDGAVAPEELATVRSLASALRIDEPRVRSLGLLAKGHLTLL